MQQPSPNHSLINHHYEQGHQTSQQPSEGP
mgnify:CR=1 FL=1